MRDLKSSDLRGKRIRWHFPLQFLPFVKGFCEGYNKNKAVEVVTFLLSAKINPEMHFKNEL